MLSQSLFCCSAWKSEIKFAKTEIIYLFQLLLTLKKIAKKALFNDHFHVSKQSYNVA